MSEEVRTTPPDLSEFHSDADELRARRDFMVREGFRFCNIMACNCNSWHGGHAARRLREVCDLLDDYGVETNGVTLLHAVETAVRNAGYTKD